MAIFNSQKHIYKIPYLVGGIPTPLKNNARQLGWWHSQYMGKKTCSKPPTSNITTLTKQSTGIVLMVNYSHNRKKANPTFIGDGLLKYGIVMNQSNSVSSLELLVG